MLSVIQSAFLSMCASNGRAGRFGADSSRAHAHTRAPVKPERLTEVIDESPPLRPTLT